MNEVTQLTIKRFEKGIGLSCVTKNGERVAIRLDHQTTLDSAFKRLEEIINQ